MIDTFYGNAVFIARETVICAVFGIWLAVSGNTDLIDTAGFLVAPGVVDAFLRDTGGTALNFAVVAYFFRDASSIHAGIIAAVL